MSRLWGVGLGDVVKYGLDKLGIKQKPGCGCAKRQAWLNRMTPGYREPNRARMGRSSLVSLGDGPVRTGRGNRARRSVRISYPGAPIRMWYPIAGGSGCTVTSDGTRADTQAKIDAASNGDVICLPAGSFSWSSQLTINKAIELRGAGVANTTITNDYTTVSSGLIQVSESTAGPVRITNITFAAGAGPASDSYYIKVFYTSGGWPVVIASNNWSDPMGGDAIRNESIRGVVANNSFDATSMLGGSSCLNQVAALRHYPPSASGISSLAILAWASPVPYGMNDADGNLKLYFETNTLVNVFQGVDTAFGSNLVFRHNEMTNSAFLHHGADTGSVSARSSEIYSNNWYWDATQRCPPDLPAGVDSLLGFRGGTSLIHDNVIPDVNSQAWGNKPEVKFFVENIRRQSSDWGCWDTGYGQCGSGANPFNNPQKYPSPMQVGWGYSTGGTEVGTDPCLLSWTLFMDLEPIYIWNNSGAGNYNTPSFGEQYSDCNTGDDQSNYMTAGTEWKLQAPPTGLPYGTGVGSAYQTYTYPHPLIGEDVGPSSPTRRFVWV